MSCKDGEEAGKHCYHPPLVTVVVALTKVNERRLALECRIGK